MSILAENKKAFFEYKILEKYEAGLVLTGNEVKSIKNGHVQLKDSFVTFHNTEALLTNIHISRYIHSSAHEEYNPTASRKLLLRAKEIEYLKEKSLQKGLTIVPLKIYTKNHLIKVEIAVAQGKHLYDKKETIKKRDLTQELKRTLKNFK